MHRSGTRLFRRFQDSSPSRHTHENLSRLQWRWCRDMDDELIVTAHGNESQHPVAASGGGALGAPPLGFFEPESDTSIFRAKRGPGMATLLFWSIVLIPVGVFAFWSSLKELSTRKAPTVSFAIWIFAWAAVTAGLECHKCPRYDLLVAHSDLAFALEV